MYQNFDMEPGDFRVGLYPIIDQFHNSSLIFKATFLV